MMIDWKAKLSSRKFWMAVAGLVSGLLMAFRVSESETTEICGIILSAGSVIAFIIGEGWADAAGAASAIVVQDEDKDE